MSRKHKRDARAAVREKPPGGDERRKRRVVEVPSYNRGEAALFAITLFLSAALLFAIQPMFAKMVLPILGGAPAVWIACLVFYQAALLGGYLYAHYSLKWLGPRRQAALHLALLCLACLALPIHAAKGWSPPATTFPAPWLWMLLTVSLGLPFLAVSASAPMLQAWFAAAGSPTQRSGGRDPYFLYAASNLGSLLALLAYPLVIEAAAGLPWQSIGWTIGYGLLMALILACAVRLWKSPATVPPAPIAKDVLSSPYVNLVAANHERPSMRRKLRWLALALVPSSLLIGVTTYISSELTPMPLLWVVPLALYLLTFVLVFAPRTVLPLRWMIWVQPILIVVTAATLFCSESGLQEFFLLGTLHLATFFVTAMVCHGQLAADRPAPSQLTEFYLWMSLGGVLGGLFSALAAPKLFNSVLEYPLMMAAACLLRPRPVAAGRSLKRREALPATALLISLVIAFGLRSGNFLSGWRFTDTGLTRVFIVAVAAFTAFLLRRRPPVFATAVGVLAAISLWSLDTGTKILHAERSFFGILRVEYDPFWNTRTLMNGTTNHGQQSLFESRRREPQAYYHRSGPLGAVFESLRPRRPLGEVGVLGLGAGGIAAYAEPGERFTFYEIDPAVVEIAQNTDYFTFLADCRGTVEIVLGDARLSLERETERKFDLLIVDVFGSDAVPVHLITKEALALYFDRMKPSGLLAVHISSRYLELAPILGKLAEDAGRSARLCIDPLEAAIGRFPSVWVVMARSPDVLGSLAGDARWHSINLQPDPGPVWTDAYSNVAGAIRWKRGGLALVPWRWSMTDLAERHAVVAATLVREDRIDEAIYHWQKSLEIDPKNATVEYFLGDELRSRGQTDEAITHLQKAIALDPDNGLAYQSLGAALVQKGKTDEAVERFQKALEILPGFMAAFRDLGKVFLDKQKYSLAEGCFRKAVEIRPDIAELRFYLGRALKKQGKIDEAKRELRQALPMAEKEKNSELIDKINVELRRCEGWPWDDER
jgi:tetratricopeptide (TPR) repeat protein